MPSQLSSVFQALLNSLDDGIAELVERPEDALKKTVADLLEASDDLAEVERQQAGEDVQQPTDDPDGTTEHIADGVAKSSRCRQ
jgi:hypothetical protein